MGLWDFGVQIGIGFLFKIATNFSVGANYSGQIDFSKFETKNNTKINNTQKMNLNSTGIILLFEL